MTPMEVLAPLINTSDNRAMHFYNCHGFHSDLPKGRASGTLSVDHTGVFIEISSLSKHITFDSLQLELGGASNRLVFIHHPSLNGWDIYTSDRGILNDSRLKDQPHLLEQLSAAKQKRASGWLTLAGLLLIMVALPILGVFQMSWVTAKVATQVPPSWEKSLGESAMAQFQISKPFLEEEDISALLSPLTQPLISALNSERYAFKFYIVDDATPNAFALPGGFVVIHSGLILKADSAEEMLGVLAHELTHVSQQHGVRSLIGTASLYLIASAMFGDASGLLATLSGAAPLLLSQSYSRDYEREADKIGFQLMERARVNPKGLAIFFQKLINEEKKRMETIEDEDTRELIQAGLDFLSTHPATEERIDYLNSFQTDEYNRYLDLQIEFNALKENVVQLISTPEDEQAKEDLTHAD